MPLSLKAIISRALSEPEFQERPPVLVDIGASLGIKTDWKHLAPFSIGIAVEGGRTAEECLQKSSGNFLKYHAISQVITAESTDQKKFYETKSPYCSSTLRPTPERLEGYAYSDLFSIVSEKLVPAISFSDILKKLDVRYIDWLKLDTQGTDLRLFKSLDQNLKHDLLRVEFEPGLIDAYEGEDKLFHILQYMNDYPFWIDEFKVCGDYRISKALAKTNFSALQLRFLHKTVPFAPGWVEVSYTGDFLRKRDYTRRQLILLWIFSAMKKQWGYCLSLSVEGIQRNYGVIFQELKAYSIYRSKLNLISIPTHLMRHGPHFIYKKIKSFLGI